MVNDRVKELAELGITLQTDEQIKSEVNSVKRGKHPGTDFLGVITEGDYQRLQALMLYATKTNLKIVTQSGGTALTGGSSIKSSKRSQGDYVILKLYQKDKIKQPEILDDGRAVKVYPGNNSLELNHILGPLGFSANTGLGVADDKGWAQYLGNIATNSAGTSAAFKGRAIDMVQSLKVLLPNGKIYDLPSKINGAPVIEEIAGMGGTTGIILEAVITTHPLPKKHLVAVVRIKNLQQMYDLLDAFKANCWDKVNLFERLNDELFKQVLEFKSRQDEPDTKALEKLGGGDLLFIELTTPDVKDNLLLYLKNSLAKAKLTDSAIIASSPLQARSFLAYRVVNASLACDDLEIKGQGIVVAHDISVPPGDIYEFPSEKLIKTLRDRIPGIKIFNFGHAAGVEKISADSPRGGTATHFNPVVPIGTSQADIDWVTEQVYSEVSARGGRIVSEHSIGNKLVNESAKFELEQYYKNLETIAKYNPNGILNPDVYVKLEDVLTVSKNNKKTPG